MLTKLLFHKVLGLTIFLATRLELLSPETIILSWRFFFSNTLNLIHGFLLFSFFKTFFKCNVVYIRLFERENDC